jgi:hypothetical protein
VLEEPLCGPCLHLARLFKREPRMFAYEPVHGYHHERDAVELPWERWEGEAGAQGKSLADLIAEPRPPG